MPNASVVTDNDIIRYYLRNSHSIKSVARNLGVQVSYAGKVINLYKKTQSR